MKNLPIIFSAPMVRRLRDDRKRETRRLGTSPLRRVKVGDRLWVRESCAAEELSRPPREVAATARERRMLGRTKLICCDELDGADGVRYLADDCWQPIESTREAGEQWSELFHYGQKPGEHPSGLRGKSVPSIHMPRWASRLTLIVEAVRFQGLQEITEAEALAEGIIEHEPTEEDPSEFSYVEGGLIWDSARDAYAALWDSLHTEEGERWADNPEIVALTFRVLHSNIDRLERIAG
jgi:hypothetical protein